jgi:hypothetical protein
VVSAAGLRTSKILSQKEFSYVRSSKNVWIYDGKFYDLLYFPAHNWAVSLFY